MRFTPRPRPGSPRTESDAASQATVPPWHSRGRTSRVRSRSCRRRAYTVAFDAAERLGLPCAPAERAAFRPDRAGDANDDDAPAQPSPNTHEAGDERGEDRAACAHRPLRRRRWRGEGVAVKSALLRTHRQWVPRGRAGGSGDKEKGLRRKRRGRVRAGVASPPSSAAPPAPPQPRALGPVTSEAAPRTDKACTAPPPGANLPDASYLSQPRTCRLETRLENLAHL